MLSPREVTRIMRGFERRRRAAWDHTLFIYNLWSKKKVEYEDLFVDPEYEITPPEEYYAHLREWAKRDPTIQVPEVAIDGSS